MGGRGGGKGKKPSSETEEADQEARRHHTPRAPSAIPEREFRRALLQEPLKDWEYIIPLEEPNDQEIKGAEDREMAEKPGGETQGFPAPSTHSPKPRQRDRYGG